MTKTKHDYGFYAFFAFVLVATLPVLPVIWLMSRLENKEHEENLKAYHNRPPSRLELLEKRVSELERR